MKEKVRQLIQQQMPTFTDSDRWVYKFVRRNHFTLRAKTSLSQRLPAGLKGKMKSFLQKVQKEWKSGRFLNRLIGNMDETPVYFNLVPPQARQLIKYMCRCEVLHHSQHRCREMAHHSCTDRGS